MLDANFIALYCVSFIKMSIFSLVSFKHSLSLSYGFQIFFRLISFFFIHFLILSILNLFYFCLPSLSVFASYIPPLYLFLKKTIFLLLLLFILLLHPIFQFLFLLLLPINFLLLLLVYWLAKAIIVSQREQDAICQPFSLEFDIIIRCSADMRTVCCCNWRGNWLSLKSWHHTESRKNNFQFISIL